MNVTFNKITGFKGIDKTNSSKNMIDTKTLKEYVNIAADKLVDNERMIPENGQYAPLAVYVDIKGEEKTARIAVEHDPINPKTQRVINLGVHKNGSDKMYSMYTVSGTKKEILNYLKNKKSKEEIYNHIVDLANRVED